MYNQQQFFQYLYNTRDPHITFRAIREPKREKGTDPTPALKAMHLPFSQIKTITAYNNKDYGVFFIPNYSGKPSTEDKEITMSFSCFIDIDNKDLSAEYFPLMPSAIISRNDGLGHHVYWFINPVHDLELWTLAQKTLIAFFKSDKTIHNPARLMRIPDTLNKKTEPYRKYEIEELNNVRYDIEKIISVHGDRAEIEKIIKKKTGILFGEEKIADGEGRHRKMIQAVFILNDYGLDETEILKHLRQLNKKHLADPYTETELETLAKSRKYAKSGNGEKLIEKERKEQAKRERVRLALDSWYYVFKTNTFINSEDPDISRTREGFNAEFSEVTEKTNAAGWVFLHGLIKTAEQLTYEPEYPVILNNKKSVFVNTWKKTDLTEIENTPDWFIEHIRYLFNADDTEHFLNYAAHIVQNPRKKIAHALLIIGPHTGTGKSLLVKVFKKILGASNVVQPHNENLGDKYTGWAKHYQLCFIHEVSQSDKKEFQNKIKPFITEDEIEIREMYQGPYTIPNFMHIIGVSNYELPLVLDAHDRRWYVLRSNAEKKDTEYYTALVQNIEQKSGEVLWYLKNRDIKKFNPGAEPPTTEAKKFIKEQSMSDLHFYIKECIDNAIEPFENPAINVREAINGLDPRYQNSYTTINRLTRILTELGCQAIPNMVSVNGVQKRLWVVRDHDELLLKYEEGKLGQYLTDLIGEKTGLTKIE